MNIFEGNDRDADARGSQRPAEREAHQILQDYGMSAVAAYEALREMKARGISVTTQEGEGLG